MSGKLYICPTPVSYTHLDVYKRQQKLSSLAAMVLGGRPPGRVARSHVVFFYCL